MLQVGSRASLLGSSVYSSLTNNVYYSAGFYRYMATDTASVLEQSAGAFKFFTAPSGTAGNAITFTQAMTLDASGKLGVGTATPDPYSWGAGIGINGSSYSAFTLKVGDAGKGYVAAGSGAMYIGGTNPLLFYTGGTGSGNEVMRLDASGNLGLGVTPGTWGASYRAIEFPGISIANLNGGTNQQAQYLLNARDAGTGTWVYKVTGSAAAMFRQTAGAYEWHTAPSGTAGNAITFTQAMTLDANGNLLVGTTGAVAGERLNITAGVLSSAAVARFSYTNNTAYSTSGYAALATLFVANQSTTASTACGIGFSTVGTGNASIASIGAVATNPSGYGCAMVFQTRGTSGADAEVMRLDSSGNLLVGTTSAIVGAAVGMRLVDTGSRMELGSAQSTNAYLGYSMYSTGAAAYRFYVGFGGTIFATSTTITAISDQRLKENIRDLDDGLGTVMALKPRKFDWKAGKGKDIKGDRGFIAQEFEQVLPDLIEEWKDPAPEGEEPYKAINANLIPTLVKAIQEQQALITKLTDRIAALEARCV